MCSIPSFCLPHAFLALPEDLRTPYSPIISPPAHIPRNFHAGGAFAHPGGFAPVPPQSGRAPTKNGRLLAQWTFDRSSVGRTKKLCRRFREWNGPWPWRGQGRGSTEESEVCEIDGLAFEGDIRPVSSRGEDFQGTERRGPVRDPVSRPSRCLEARLRPGRSSSTHSAPSRRCTARPGLPAGFRSNTRAKAAPSPWDLLPSTSCMRPPIRLPRRFPRQRGKQPS